VLVPLTAGVMGNIGSSAIMVPKELITKRMQAGAKGGALLGGLVEDFGERRCAGLVRRLLCHIAEEFAGWGVELLVVRVLESHCVENDGEDPPGAGSECVLWGAG